MFSTRLKEFSHTLSLRLSLGYAAIFTGSALILFVLIYVLLGAAINQKDHDLVESRLREYQTIYQSGGVPALKDWINHVVEAQRQQTFFVRGSKADQSVLYMILPADWLRTDLQRIGTPSDISAYHWLRIP